MLRFFRLTTSSNRALQSLTLLVAMVIIACHPARTTPDPPMRTPPSARWIVALPDIRVSGSSLGRQLDARDLLATALDRAGAFETDSSQVPQLELHATLALTIRLGARSRVARASAALTAITLDPRRAFHEQSDHEVAVDTDATQALASAAEIALTTTAARLAETLGSAPTP